MNQAQDEKRPYGAQQYSPPVEAKEDKKMDAAETRAELVQAIKGSNEVLVSATTVLSFFPDTFTLDRAKLTVTKRHFFSTAEVMSIRVEDILNSTAKLDPFFGSIEVVSRVMGKEQVHTVGNFWRRDAIRLKRITQGYVIALQRRIDCSALGIRELSALLEKLGEDNHEPAKNNQNNEHGRQRGGVYFPE